ncbi:MAG: AmmeMemoRadiSam system protein A [Myxococcales bacterium]|nr:AmmeMemoRadiSam system protein A [Myxococcales bacterium]
MSTLAAELSRHARAVIAEALGGPRASDPPAEARRKGAAFVTLRFRQGRLQGCIGTLEAQRSLAEDVRRNALAAAFDDPRARPLTLADLADLDVEVSLLSPLEPVEFHDEPSALAALRPGVDGVVLSALGRRGTFLPQMWRELREPRRFLDELKQKAGFSPRFWSDDVRLERYTVDEHVDRAGGPEALAKRAAS